MLPPLVIQGDVVFPCKPELGLATLGQGEGPWASRPYILDQARAIAQPGTNKQTKRSVLCHELQFYLNIVLDLTPWTEDREHCLNIVFPLFEASRLISWKNGVNR